MSGRPERPLDPDEGPVQRLAYELRTLRERAGGPTYREMARLTGSGASTLSQAAAGDRLPSLEVVLAYVRACGGHAGEWEERWHRMARQEAARPGAEEGASAPYRGLKRFEPGDRELFFGREELTAELAAHVAAHRLVAVVGASGSGKSSLLRAGLIPILQDPAGSSWRPAAIRILTPGPRPLATHAEALAPSGSDGDTVVLIDQFEELFTLCTDTAQRTGFLDLLPAALRPGSRLRVVIAVRADFFARCAEHQPLAEAIRGSALLVGPMSPAELHDAIVKPAIAVGLSIERSLTARIVREVSEEPGSLPLMSHALLETWRRRRGRVLTEEMYDAAGGIHAAIARTAEEVFTQLSPTEAEAARRILLRLITPGEGAQDTRRPTQHAELATGSGESARALELIVKARLLTLDGDTVDLAHEALITAWPRYRAWIEEDRERLRTHRHLTESARAWHEVDRDSGALYRGTRLATAREAFDPEDPTVLTDLERAFLTASTAAHEHETRRAARTTRRLRALTTTLTILLILAVTASIVAWQQTRSSQARQRVALSRQLAAQSAGLIGTDPDLSALLAVTAYRSSPTTEAVNSLYAAAALPLRRRVTGPAGRVRTVALSPDGHTVATADPDGTVRLWDTASGKVHTTLVGRSGPVESMIFSPDGRTLATSEAHTVRLWDVTSGRARAALARRTTAHASLAFTPDGRTLATSDSDGGIGLWDAATGKARGVLRERGPWLSSALAFGPDGRTLAAAAGPGAIVLWNVPTHRVRATLKATVKGQPGIVEVLAFSPDGRILASGGSDATVRLWDTSGGRLRATLTGHSEPIEALAFSSDGSTLASGGGDTSVRLWDPATGQPRATLTGHSQAVEALVFGPDGHTLASGGDDNTVRLWDTAAGRPRAVLTDRADADSRVVYSPDGHTLAAGGDNGVVVLWNTMTGRARTVLAGSPEHVGSVPAPAFSPDGRILATVLPQNGDVRLWDVTTGRARATLSARSLTYGSPTFSPDGRTLATSNTDGTTQLWDVASGRLRLRVTGTMIPSGGPAFSPDGHTLVTEDGNLRVRLWDVATGRARATLTPSHTAVDAVAFSPDGRTVVTTGNDGLPRLWDAGTGRLNATLHAGAGPVTSVAVSPDGRTLATANGNGAVELWDMATHHARVALDGGFLWNISLAFSPDGRTLATLSDNAKPLLWDITTGDLRTTLDVGRTPAASAAFSPDGRTLAVADGGALQLWSVALPDPAAAIDRICRAVGADLTPQQRAMYLGDQSSRPVCPAPSS